GDNEDEVVIACEVEQRLQVYNRATALRRGQWQQPRRSAKANRRSGDDLPAGRSDLYHAPMIIAEIEIDGAIGLGDTKVYHALGTIELSARLQLFERVVDDPTTRSDTRCSVVGTTQEGSKSSAADRPSFAVPVDHQICIGRASRGVKKLGTNRQVAEVHGSTQA